MADDSFPLKDVADDLENVNEGFDTSKEDDNLLNNELSSEPDEDKGSTGFGIFTGAVFIVSAVAGTGVLVLPVAIAKTGWYGLLILAVVGVTQTYTGILLGRCWVILQERFELYRRQTRYPYAAIGYEAFGPIGRFIVTVVIDVTLIGACVAFLLIISRNIEILLQLEYLQVCTVLPMVALALCPLVWFGTPKDFCCSLVLSSFDVRRLLRLRRLPS
ncbi:uncharacterized protein [Apostichopus japonicus]|uniref:uncharacterized protein isoform X2 n=1 Tax=Stichopus japonicus TaxID=307972 RepID=UPI003AB41C84